MRVTSVSINSRGGVSGRGGAATVLDDKTVKVCTRCSLRIQNRALQFDHVTPSVRPSAVFSPPFLLIYAPRLQHFHTTDAYPSTVKSLLVSPILTTEDTQIAQDTSADATNARGCVDVLTACWMFRCTALVYQRSRQPRARQ